MCFACERPQPLRHRTGCVRRQRPEFGADAGAPQDAEAFLFREARALDDKDWDAWLACYAPDAEFWMPAWDDDDRLTEDPQSEISLIYCGNRARMEDRVWRIESRLSSSLLRLPRTRHLVTNVRVRSVDAAEVVVTANFQVNTYKHEEKRTDLFFGHYRYRLARKGDALSIREKYIVVCNDIIPRQMDIFNV